MADSFDILLCTGERFQVKLAQPQGSADADRLDISEMLPDFLLPGENEDPAETTDPGSTENTDPAGDSGEDPGFVPDPTEGEGETSEPVENQTEGDDGDEGETVLECDHGWYPEVTIGLGVLSLGLIIAVILLALRGKSGKRRSKAGKGKKEPETMKRESLLPTNVQVGKLHNIGARESQQDCLAVSPRDIYETKGLLAVVADGMGGLSDGDKMSQTAASAMLGGFVSARETSLDMILPLTEAANQAVNRVLGINRGRSGTTLVAGIVKDNLFSYVSVGDSRICLYRGGMLTQLNREHVYRNELSIQAINGNGTFWDAATHPKAAGLTSYLGMGSLKYVDIPAEPLRLRAGDKIILMSDGVYNALSLPEMEQAMAGHAQKVADTLGQMIAAKGYVNQDNYTAVILEF